tara:strand:+ start:2039 stop:3214 length:1176 start_codon:yes stop_codon:yes gene_type:complete
MGSDKFKDEFCLNFDGSNDYLSLSSNVFTNATTYTVGCWIKYLGLDTYDWLFGAGSTTKNFGLNRADNHIFYREEDGEYYSFGATSNIPTNKWTHLVFTANDTSISCYANGKLVGTITVNSTTSIDGGGDNSDKLEHTKFSFNRINAAYQTGGSNNFLVWCKMSSMFAYDCYMTQSQVKTIYNDREPYNHNEGIARSNLKGWWRMGDGILDHKATTDAQGGIVCDMTNATLGSDIFGGRGNFTDNSDSYWTFAGAGASNGVIEDGVCKFNASGSNNCSLQKAGMLTVGQMYRLDVDVTSVDSTAAGGTSLVVDDGNPYIRVCETTDGITSHTMYWVPQNNTAFKLYRYNTNTDGVAYDEAIQFDNLRVRAVNGNVGYMENMRPEDFTGDTP